jgi:hypothetical protein
MIENNILAISNAMFKNKKDWDKVTDEQKEQFFFIFNRYFSKKYPEKSSQLNSLKTPKNFGLDLWFEFMKNQPYPQWFWSKSKKNSTSDFDDKTIFELRKKYDLKTEELEFLFKHHREEIIEEIEYLNKTKK